MRELEDMQRVRVIFSAGWLPALKALNFPRPRRLRLTSAMIDRAEFPVQRNSTFSGSLLLTTFTLSSLTTLNQCRRDERLANLWAPATAILDEE
jgi:hypothetical protein